MAGSSAVLEYIESVVYGDRRRLRDLPILGALRALSFIYRIGLRLYLLPFDLGIRRRKRLPVPVISIGNVTMGGTGKTPMTRYICEGIMSRGRRPAALSYGYGGSLSGEFSVVSLPDTVLLSAREVGDEPAMLASKLPGVPVLVGKHRYESGLHAVKEFGSDVAVLDDGFQVWKLHRDLDIVLVDGMRPFDNGRTLPAGKLREPVSALRRADCIVITGDGPSDEARAQIARVAPGAAVFSARHVPIAFHAIEDGEEIGLERIRGRKVFALSSIAHPESFERTGAETGASLSGIERFPDHYLYTQEDVSRVENKARECGAEFIVTTEKDGVKLEGMRMNVPFLALATRLSISDEERLWDIIWSAVSSHRTPYGRSSN